MIPNQTKYLLILFFWVSLLSVPHSILAQQKFEYNGTLQVDKYTGDAVYHYKLVDGDTLIDGPFQLRRSSLEALLDKEDVSFIIQGDFTDGSPNGPWRFQFGEFKSNSESKVVDFEYRVLISGIQEEGSGDIKNGKPNGKWLYEVNRVKDSEKEKTLFKSEISFENGVPQRNFEVENEDAILVGRFLRNGLAHDEWTSYDIEEVEDTESWFFEEGLLHKIQIIEEGEKKEISVFNGKSSEFETINLDERYINILKITLDQGSESVKLRENLTNLLADNAAYYRKIDRILSELGTSDFKPKFKVQVPYFGLDSLEREKLNGIQNTYKTAAAISADLLNDSQLNILKRSDVDALYHYNTVVNIQENFLNPVEKFVSLIEQDIAAFVKRDRYIEKLWPNGKPSTSIEVLIDTANTTRTFALPNANSFHFEGNTMEALQQVSTYAKISLENIRGKLSDQLSNEKRFQALINLEEKLIVKNEALIQEIDSLSGILPEDYSKPLFNIKKLVDESLSNYASLEAPEEKLKYGETIENCFKELSELTHAIAALPTQAVEIDSLYQDSVFNPFMAVVMDEEVKKRITTAYKKVLVPYFLNTSSNTLTCGTTAVLKEEIQHLYQRMLLLRDEDTKKLERKLRREKDPQIILQLLSVPSKKGEK